jgi:hypothetical protein
LFGKGARPSPGLAVGTIGGASVRAPVLSVRSSASLMNFRSDGLNLSIAFSFHLPWGGLVSARQRLRREAEYYTDGGLVAGG